MIRLFLASLLWSIQCACAIEVHVPDGWSQAEVPSRDVPYGMPPTLRPMIRVVPSGKIGTATLSEMKVQMSLDEAAQRYARGMPMRGINVESTAKVMHRGHEGRHIKGNLSLAGNGGSFPVEVYLIMTEECILSVEVISEEASSMIHEVLNWIEFQPATVPAQAHEGKGASGRSFWEYLGMGMVFSAVGYAIFNSIRDRRKRPDEKL